MDNSSLKDFWDIRFAREEYVYGTAPNAFFKSVIDQLTPGTIFIPGAGEGRDAVYAASKGWVVYCTDLSEAGRQKALQLAQQQQVTITYEVGDIAAANYPTATFDVVASIFFHLPSAVRQQFYAHCRQWLKPGGHLIVQAFRPEQIGNASGGPKDPDMLLNIQKIHDELNGFDTLFLQETEEELQEGTFHKGMASLTSYTGQNK